MTLSNKKTFVCFSLRLAKFLMSQGFELVDIKPNKQNLQFKVFYFKNNKKLQEAVNNYLTLIKSSNRG